MNAPERLTLLEPAALQQFTDERWDQAIVPALQDYIAIPAKSPMFDAQWAQQGLLDRVAREQATDLLGEFGGVEAGPPPPRFHRFGISHGDLATGLMVGPAWALERPVGPIIYSRTSRERRPAHLASLSFVVRLRDGF